MESIKLNAQNLSSFADKVRVPTYDRSKVKAGIVHVGIGGFHRAHQAYYTDELLHTKGHEHWGICGIALLDFDTKIFNTLKEQDGLYTLVIKELDGSLTKAVIGSIVEYLFAPEDPLKVIEKMADSAIKIISLTITEGGYNYNEATKQFDFENPAIQHDLEHPRNPKTIFGYLTQAFKLRKERNLNGLSIQSCDNIQANGHLTQKMLLSFVQKAAPDLVEWISLNVSFPNSMVDRITPVTSPIDIEALKNTSGIDDAWPVVCEPYKQWVIEDEFVTGRPPWEKVGAQFVANVAPYEKMKLCLLNAGHSVLGILGASMGYDTIDEAISNQNISSFLNRYMVNEVIPVLGDLEGINLEDYIASLLERFGNKYIKDQIDRICSESSAKIPIFIMPTVTAQLAKNGSVKRAAFVIAAWAIYSKGYDEKGKALNIKDAMKYNLIEKAKMATEDSKAFLELEAIFGNIKNEPVFVKAFTNAYENIEKFGVEKCLIAGV